MDDKQIIDLFWKRSENAITETDKKYGRYLLYIAANMLSDDEDAREVQNDTYLRAWNSMPPENPVSLRSYVGAKCYNNDKKITKRVLTFVKNNDIMK